jgi:hypothetical protein
MATEAIITIVEWPSEKKNPTATGRWPYCISFRVTLSIIYRGDVIRIDSVAKPESVGEDSGAQEQRIVVQRKKRPYPGKQIAANQQRIQDDESATHWRRSQDYG